MNSLKWWISASIERLHLAPARRRDLAVFRQHGPGLHGGQHVDALVDDLGGLAHLVHAAQVAVVAVAVDLPSGMSNCISE